jgi:hypothetical protein
MNAISGTLHPRGFPVTRSFALLLRRGLLAGRFSFAFADENLTLARRAHTPGIQYHNLHGGVDDRSGAMRAREWMIVEVEFDGSHSRNRSKKYFFFLSPPK